MRCCCCCKVRRSLSLRLEYISMRPSVEATMPPARDGMEPESCGDADGGDVVLWRRRGSSDAPFIAGENEDDGSSMMVPLNRGPFDGVELLPLGAGADFFVGFRRGRPFGLPGATTFFFDFLPVGFDESFDDEPPVFFFDEEPPRPPPRPLLLAEERLLPRPPPAPRLL